MTCCDGILPCRTLLDTVEQLVANPGFCSGKGRIMAHETRCDCCSDSSDKDELGVKGILDIAR